ncbi:hypothetical protein M8818_006247 [Zalaria obscura]|uniref:Uncharacterized protein n=1 Tax=Zalaria obscura TaxID=2024903 RepID=A0ACC3S7C9_9PEZI
MVALVCVALGYMMTAGFAPTDDSLAATTSTDRYAKTQEGVLRGPEYYDPITGDLLGTESEQNSGKRPLPKLQYSDENEDIEADHGPSIKGALSDLNHAVSNKFGSWRSWSAPRPDGKSKGTAKLDHPSTDNNNLSALSSVSDELIEPNRESLGERTRIGKCTIIFGGAAIYDRAVRTHETHDRVHGYPLHVLRESMMDSVWSKPAYILSLILRELAKPESERLQWLLWVDADTILLNPYVPIETFLPPSPEFDDVHLVVSNDWNGLNNGVFPIRVNSWAAELFASIVSFRHFHPDTHLRFRDQSAMSFLLREKVFAAHTVYCPQRWFNAYQGEHNETLAPFQARRGDFLVHFAGVGNREERMRYWLERAEQHLPDWEIEVQHTSYPTEARDFWAEKARERSAGLAKVAEERQKADELLRQVDERMAEYQTRLGEADKTSVRDREKQLRTVLEPAVKMTDAEALGQAITALEKVSCDADRHCTQSAKRTRTDTPLSAGYCPTQYSRGGSSQSPGEGSARHNICGGERFD